MTDRYNALVVALDRDIRDDDAEKIINAISMMKGVSGVTGNVVEPNSYVAEMRVKNDVAKDLFDIIEKLRKK